MENKNEKKYIVIKRKGCIGCGACMVASNGECYFLDGKSWCNKKEMDNIEEIIDVCPTRVIESATLEEYEQAEAELINEGILKK